MNIKIHSSELNRMMKTIIQCIEPKSSSLGNIEIVHDNNLLSIRGTDGTLSAVMSAPLLGSGGDSFCVDGTMFARVCAMCNGEITIMTDGKVCTVKGAGRTRIPIVKTDIPAFKRVTGKTCKIRAEVFSKAYNSVAYAISSNQNMPVLTGVRMEAQGDVVKMISLDGFRMAMEQVPCESDEMQAVVIPGAFMKLVSASTYAGEVITIATDGKRVQASTDGMLVACTLLSGDFPDCKRIVPESFKTSSVLYAAELQSALKSGSVVNTSNNLVKLFVNENNITISSNSEQADFEAEVNCATNGDSLKIAFNHKYLMDTIASIIANEITMQFNSPISPCVIRGKESDGYRLILPVRVQG